MNRFTSLTPVDDQGNTEAPVRVDLTHVLWMEPATTGTRLYLDDPGSADSTHLINNSLVVAESREEILALSVGSDSRP